MIYADFRTFAWTIWKRHLLFPRVTVQEECKRETMYNVHAPFKLILGGTKAKEWPERFVVI
jgi:hypothetical protein